MNLQLISYDQVPHEAIGKFEFYSSRYITPDNYTPKNFNGFWKMAGDLGDIFITKQGTKTGLEDEDTLYVYQFDKDGNPLGYADIGQLKNKKNPYVYLYFIGAIQKEQGFAKNMIPVLNLLAKDFFKKPLNSSTTFCTQIDGSNPVLKIFERLASESKVKREKNGSFTFVSEQTQKILQTKSPPFR